MPKKKRRFIKRRRPSPSGGQPLSEKILASNHFNQRRRQNRRLKKNGNGRLQRFKERLASFKKRQTQQIVTFFRDRQHYRTLKKDRKIKRRAEYLNQLPTSPARRWLYKLRPLNILRFIFSLRGLLLGLKIGLVLFILGATLLTVVYLHYRKDVPTSIANLQSCIKGQTTKYYDRTGKILLWSSKSDVDCQPVTLDDVSSHLINALISAEDRTFFEHEGFQIGAIIRAAYNNLFKDQEIQGGSTITQQYIKNAILKDPGRNFSRKIKELIVAIELERTFTKEEILTAYLNTVSFGSIYNGVEAASLGYFGKSARDLTLDEAALLVAALPAPTTYWDNPELHQQAQRSVMRQMLSNGYIEQEEFDAAMKVDTLEKVIVSHKQYEDIRAPHFILEAEKRLTRELCALEQSENQDYNCSNIRLQGYTIITTLDVQAQKLAEDTVAAVIPTITPQGFDNAAVVAVEVDTGKVLALVGSRDFTYEGFGQTNTVTQQRDPGSTFKLFNYATLIENGDSWGPGSILYDYETTFNDRGWTPRNYSGRHAGPITMRRALGHSLNIPAIKAMYISGIEAVHDMAYKTGIRTKLPCTGGCGLASAIGGGSEVRLDELTNAYATFSRQGTYLPLTYIERVEDAEGKLLRQWRARPEQVVKTETTYLLNHMLADKSVRYTTDFNLNPSLQTTMAVKTGTDDNYINNHIIGYTKAVAFGGWIGNHDEAVLFDHEINTVPAKSLMIKTFMEGYHRDTPYEKRIHWPRPAGIKQVKLDLITGYQVSDQDQDPEAEPYPRPTRTDIFPSWYVPQVSPQKEEKLVAIDTVSGKLATECTPAQAVRQVAAIQITNEIAIDDPFYDEWQEPILAGLAEERDVVGLSGAIDDLHQCDDQRPRIEVLEKPESCLQSCLIRLRVEAGTFPLQTLKISNNFQTLPDGEIALSQTPSIVSYTYRPLELASPAETRGALQFEVIDEGLYSRKINVLLDIEGFPSALPPDESIRLTQAVVEPETKLLTVHWNRPAPNMTLNFSGNCHGLNPVYLDDQATFVEIDANGYPPGLCQVYLLYGQNQRSNSWNFRVIE